MARKIETLMLDGPSGRLECLLEEPEAQEPTEAALVCHPHPQHGGTMHNKVVYRIARGLRKTGSVVLRFNYRGVNLSEGEYGHGLGELEDARFLLGWLRTRYPALPYTVAGFSFGSRVALTLGCGLPDVRRIIAVGLPTTYRDYSFVAGCVPPKIFIHSTNDEHGPRPDFEALYSHFSEPKQLVWVDAEDHFFKGGLDGFENAVVGAPY